MSLSQKPPNSFCDRVQEWDIYHRLLELGIPCREAPLRIQEVDTAQAIQVWCVARAVIAPKQEQVDFLEECWSIKYE